MSRRDSIQSQRGFTMIEVVIVSVIALASLGAMGALVGSAQDLTDDTRTNTRATAEHRKNLRVLSNLLRSVDINTLQGFDDDGRATEPTFLRVSGVDLDDRSYLADERLVWKPDAKPVWGVERPGAVYLETSGGDRIVARNVPANGFALRQEGATLAIELTTYYSLGERRTFHVTSETAVSLRN